MGGTRIGCAASAFYMATLSVDPGARLTAARRMEDAADILAAALGAHLGGLQSGTAAVDQLVADMGQWTCAAREVAASLRLGADRYLDGEAAAVAALR